MTKQLSRRHFLALTGTGLVVGCSGLRLPSEAERKVPRVGYLSGGGDQERADGFRQGLADLGYVEGENVIVEWRDFAGQTDRLSDLVAELIDLPADVLVVAGAAALGVAIRATKTTPIVMAQAASPLEDGFVASLARPGGNVTGLTGMSRDLIGKRLEVFKEVVPGLSRIGVLWNPGITDRAGELQVVEAAATGFNLQLLPLEARTPSAVAPAFERAALERVDGLYLLDNVVLTSRPHEVAHLALSHRLPMMSANRPFATAGGLVTYGANIAAMGRRSATYVDKILKGADPGVLPVELPPSFDFVLNLGTAKFLGLSIPQSVLAQATEIIQ